MSPGKLCSQAGHAYLGAYLNALTVSPCHASAYAQELPGTKVCLACDSLERLYKSFDLAKSLSIPCFLVVDSGCENFFNGEPTVTALGLGPATKPQIERITRKFKLL